MGCGKQRVGRSLAPRSMQRGHLRAPDCSHQQVGMGTTSSLTESLETILARVATGRLRPETAAQAIQALAPSHSPGYEAVGSFAHVDHNRAKRTGMPEVVFGEGKTPEQLVGIFESLQGQGQTAHSASKETASSQTSTPLMMATRVSPEQVSLVDCLVHSTCP